MVLSMMLSATIVQSIDLTRLPTTDTSTDALYQRVGRSTFCKLLDSFWWKFAWNWEVLLGGNPAVDMYNGIKLSAGGELGVGVGEEEWGSGEREVLEDFVVRTDGLVDLVVSRFGDPWMPIEDQATCNKSELENQNETIAGWLGLDTHPRPSDGVIFSGMGAISRPSVARVSQWMEWIYRYGPDAYGVGENPTSPRRRKQRKRQQGRSSKDSNNESSTTPVAHTGYSFSPGIPRPLVTGQPQETEAGYQTSSGSSPAPNEIGKDWMGLKTETFVKYLKLGYGSSWGPSAGTASSHPRVEALKQEDESTSVDRQATSTAATQETSDEGSSKSGDAPSSKNLGRFMIGLHNGLDTRSIEDADLADKPPGGLNENIMQRALHVHLTASNEEAKLRVAVYIHQPFIYTFLFDSETPSLSDPSLYRSIHHQLSPLHKPLINSTSPANAAARISVSEGAFDINQRFLTKNQPVYDLVYDPSNLTIRTSIPNIPDLGTHPPGHPDSNITPWLRVESLNIHHRLLSTYVETRSRPLELERTCKTSRGWWIVWVRFSESDSGNIRKGPPIVVSDDVRQEAFLIRKASDHVSSVAHARNSSGSRFFRDLSGASSPGLASSRTDTGPGKLVEGLGLDARRYIENLLSLNR
ncbi:hypothetical protein EYZ11_007918 [Aspergillus tanneri]|uniref:CCZ1/INTU/HSP4 first Longin domain-containing protein n=1 Tax=Aspergillus tanneri TaxID=1220188 RepID=A0A4S3JDY0_9EURO|nr:hypothetical protein EYZ11_007918 [Aspergillus tanneri]